MFMRGFLRGQLFSGVSQLPNRGHPGSNDFARVANPSSECEQSVSVCATVQGNIRLTLDSLRGQELHKTHFSVIISLSQKSRLDLENKSSRN
jgi:hypothetical protein